jgi:hypothetical protein
MAKSKQKTQVKKEETSRIDRIPHAVHQSEYGFVLIERERERQTEKENLTSKLLPQKKITCW